MKVEGGCYCGAVRYQIDGEPVLNAQCHCRECQFVSGGGPNLFVAVPQSAVRYIKGTPKVFRRSDLEQPVAREFCAECGTHLISYPPAAPGLAVVKIGTLDDPTAFGNPNMAIYTVDKQPFHQVPEGMPAFERLPG